MNKNLIETILGAVVLLGAVVFFLYATRSADNGPVEGYTVTASFSDIGALRTGNDVRIGGVTIGTVQTIDLNPDSYMANLTMSINPDIRLPEDTGAKITSEGLMGGAYVGLEPGGAEDYLNEGGRIAYTQAATNLEQLLGKFIFTLTDSKKSDESAAAAESTTITDSGLNIPTPPATGLFE